MHDTMTPAIGSVFQPIDPNHERGLIRAYSAGEEPLTVSYRPADILGDNPPAGASVRFSIRSFTNTTAKEQPDALAGIVRLTSESAFFCPMPKPAHPPRLPEGAELVGELVAPGSDGGEILVDDGRRFYFGWQIWNRSDIPPAERIEGLRVIFTVRGGAVASIAKAPAAENLLSRVREVLGV